MRLRSRRLALAGTVCSLLIPALAGCGTTQGTADPTDATARQAAAALAPAAEHVVAISLDGFNPKALKRLGKKKTPVLHRLIRQGAATLNARAQVELTITLPNHSSMITSRRINADKGGHGVTWNVDLPKKTIQKSSGDPDISSVFEVVHDNGGNTALFSTKTKFTLFNRSWPAAVNHQVIREERDGRLVELANEDLAENGRTFTFLHLGKADQIGHAKGWLSPAYLRAVRKLDRLVGSVIHTIKHDEDLADSTVVVLTADHGGVPGTKNHKWRKRLDDYRVPFLIWGPGVAKGDLYDLNRKTRKDPGTGRPTFSAKKQPIRNGEVGNLALDLLGMPTIPDSLWDADQDLTWTD